MKGEAFPADKFFQKRCKFLPKNLDLCFFSTFVKERRKTLRQAAAGPGKAIVVNQTKKKMKKVLLLAALAILFVAAVTSIKSHIFESEILSTNVEALADKEGRGLLWSKDWQPCNFYSITIQSVGTNGSASAGLPILLPGESFTVVDVSAVFALFAQGCTFTCEKGDGQKSYCYDGWNFCKEDGCR